MDVRVTSASFELILFVPALLDACGCCGDFHKELSKYQQSTEKQASQIRLSTSECILCHCLDSRWVIWICIHITSYISAGGGKMPKYKELRGGKYKEMYLSVQMATGDLSLSPKLAAAF